MMTKERRADLEALADKDPHMCLLRELLNEIAELEAQAVVVPDITDDDFESISILMQENGIGCHSEDDESFRRIVASTWAYTQGFRAIPADRELGEGMVQVDRVALALLIDCATGAVRHHYEGSCPDEVEGPNVRDNGCVVCNAIETIRANRGGIGGSPS